MNARKRFQKHQDRNGNPARRRLEFECILDQVKRRKSEFIARLQRHIRPAGDCLIFDGTMDHNGYPRMNFKFKGQHITLHAHRLFMILKNCALLPAGYEAGHEPGCPHRGCVRHLTLQHFRVNSVTNGPRAPRSDVPF